MTWENGLVVLTGGPVQYGATEEVGQSLVVMERDKMVGFSQRKLRSATTGVVLEGVNVYVVV